VADPATINAPNRKQLVLDPGPRTVSGANAPAQDFKIASKGLKPFDITTLGRILTDADGNLIVLGGEGSSGTTDLPAALPPTSGSYANNNGWFDDVSDGPVSGTLVLQDGSKVAIDAPAWVLCGPPKYAPEIFNLVTMYDTMYDVFVREFGLNPALFKTGGFQPGYTPNLTAEIRSLLSRPNLYRYVAQIGGFGVNQHAAVQKQTAQQFAGTLQVIRSPADPNAGPALMPKLAGDNPITDETSSDFLTLTATQYFVLQQFAAGKFADVPPPPIGEGVASDQASLENCVGGAFCPGIEMTWSSRNKTIYTPLPANPSMSDVFRLRHKDVSGGLTLTNGADNDYSAGLEPGDASKYMAQPWQADFNECSIQPIPNGGKQ
jgi:L-lysine epsilon oxidase C-terminal domain/L-Lysine epsilon oxidase N-terminal